MRTPVWLPPEHGFFWLAAEHQLLFASSPATPVGVQSHPPTSVQDAPDKFVHTAIRSSILRFSSGVHTEGTYLQEQAKVTALPSIVPHALL